MYKRQTEERSFNSGIAHTRWATHGLPTEQNAHPHQSDGVALVHNGIIENYLELKSFLSNEGYQFHSDTDSEVAAHLIAYYKKTQSDSLKVLEQVISRLKGAYAFAISFLDEPGNVYFARKGSPLVVGVGLGENFIASDQLALRPVTDQFIFLEEGDYGVISADQLKILDANNSGVERPTHRISEDSFDASKGVYKHFMLKEIYEQPAALQRCLAGRISYEYVLDKKLLESVESIQIIACGTSYHAGLIAKYLSLIHI